MDLSEYVVGTMVASRLAEARQEAAAQALVDSLGRRPSAVVGAVGRALIALGQRLAGPSAPVRQTAIR